MPSVTRTPSAGRERREAIEERVLRAAEDLMAGGRAYTEIPVQAIAREAGIARSTFYVHFPDKTELLMRLAEHATADLFAAAESWWRGEHREGLEGVERTMREMLAGFRAHRRILLALVEVAAYEPAVGAYWNQRVEGFIALVGARLRELQAAGLVEEGIDTDATARTLTWLVERGLSQHVRLDADGDGDAAIAQALARAIWLVTYGSVRAGGA
jgi:AcrR family transcriptional regulator